MVVGSAKRALMLAGACAALGLFVHSAMAADNPASGVHILKGKPLDKPVQAEAASAPQDAAGNNLVMGSGGRHMWLFNRATGQVTDCQSIATYYGGQPQIDCTTQPLAGR